MHQLLFVDERIGSACRKVGIVANRYSSACLGNAQKKAPALCRGEDFPAGDRVDQ
jgi:hypothetical protein